MLLPMRKGPTARLLTALALAALIAACAAPEPKPEPKTCNRLIKELRSTIALEVKGKPFKEVCTEEGRRKVGVAYEAARDGCEAAAWDRIDAEAEIYANRRDFCE